MAYFDDDNFSSASLTDKSAMIYRDIGENPIFFGGPSRCGTTILGQCLGAHSEIIARDELGWLTYFVQFMNAMNESDSPQYSRIALPHDELLQRLARLMFDCSVEKYIKIGAFEQNPIRRWAGKVSLGGGYFEQLNKLYPKAKFVVIIRNGVAACESVRKWGREDFDFIKGCNAWRDVVELALELEKHDNVLLVRHENMIRHGESFWQQLCAFVDIPLQSAMLQRSGTVINSSFVANDKVQQSSFLQRPNPHSQWTDEQLSLFMEVCAGTMFKAGYELPQRL